MAGPTLEIPEPSHIFYIKTDWSKDGVGAVLLQADGSVEARKSEAQEKDSKNCEFEKSLEGIQLQPSYFISISTVFVKLPCNKS